MVKMISSYRLCDPYVEKLIERRVEEVTKEFARVLENGWQVAIQLEDNREAKPYLNLNLCDSESRGGFATTKMRTLQTFPDHAYTGYTRLGDLRQDLKKLCGSDSDIRERVFDYLDTIDSPRQVRMEVHELLRDNFEFTLWHGGIRVPYQFERWTAEYTIERPLGDRGEIRVAFSGAIEFIDVGLSYKIMAGIQESLQRLWSADRMVFDLKGLKGDQIINFWNQEIPLLGGHAEE